jgi:hypothetical protein
MQTAVNRVIRFGRATMLAIGVGVSLALVLGAATVALAAVPGDPFKLGKVNQIENATTTLRASFEGLPIGNRPVLEVVQEQGTGGPALRVENANSGIGSSAIQLKVPPNRPPISVNSDAGKAISLNADKLDGKTEEDFVSASRLYGVSQVRDNTSGDKTVFFSLGCDDGDVAISGGGNAVDDNDALNDLFPFAGSYQISFTDNDPVGSKFRAIIMCSDSSKPFRDQ